MPIINLTPHTLNFYVGDEVVSIPSSGVARVSVTKVLVDHINGIPVYMNTYGQVEDMLDPYDGNVYVVSALTAQALKHRQDVYIPDDLVRDDQGRIIGCRALATV